MPRNFAINQIYRCAGYFRDDNVTIQYVKHQPPAHTTVPGLVNDMCEYVHANWDRSPVHLASYLMWRINWIHPFFGGNGRTARAISYLILCAKVGFTLPGNKTIPELIVGSRTQYFDALQAADLSWEQKRLDVSAMEELMSNLLAEQLLAVHEVATGKRAQ